MLLRRHNTYLLRNLSVVLLSGMWWIAGSGCDQSDLALESPQSTSQPSSKLVGVSASTQSILDRCLLRYQSLRSYQDQAVAELHYHLKGQPALDRVPMNVAWDRSGRLGLRVYSLVAGPTASGRWHAKIDGTRPEFDGQMLSRRLPDSLHLEWLLRDPTLREEISAGLAGFPPQLNLLLSPTPLAGLLELASTVSLDAPQLIDDRLCSTLVVEVGQLVYQLWIDQESHMLRRIQLPTQNLPSAILQDPAISQVRLLIEFKNIQTNHAIYWDEFRVPTRDGDHRVTRFVPRPPKIDLQGYGKALPAFHLLDPAGQIAYDSRPRPSRKASVLIWLADHPSCQITAEQLSSVQETLQKSGVSSETIEFVSVWAEPNPPRGLTFDQLIESWKLPGRLVIDRDAAGRDLFQVEEAPTLVILDANGRMQIRDVQTNPLWDVALPAFIQRVSNGENLATEIIEAQSSAQLRYEALLAQASSSDRLPHQISSLGEYPPGNIQLTEKSRRTFPSRVQISIQDQRQTSWVLLADGTLHRLGPNLESDAIFQTCWIQPGTKSVRLVPSQDSRFFAHLVNRSGESESSQLTIFDAKSSQEVQFNLPERCSIVDLRWLSVSDDRSKGRPERRSIASEPQTGIVSPQFQRFNTKKQRLAVITDTSQLLLLDPENREQLSGTCPEQPLALLDFIPEDSSDEPNANRLGSQNDQSWPETGEPQAFHSTGLVVAPVSHFLSSTTEQTVVGSVVLLGGKVEPIHIASDPAGSAQKPTAPQSNPDSLLARAGKVGKLNFDPLSSPWESIYAQGGWQVLARGLLEKDEPALFLIDQHLRTVWHYAMPIDSFGESVNQRYDWRNAVRIAQATSPGSGLTMWAVLDEQGTVHLIRGDAGWSDNFRLDSPPSGMALLPLGDRLQLHLSFPEQVISFQID